MKKFFVFLSIILVFFLFVLIYNDRMEWTMYPKSYVVSIPVNVKEGTLKEFEEHTKIEVQRKFPNSYLAEISLLLDSNEAFEKLSKGTIKITYCSNLGSMNGYYNYDRFAHCVFTIDLEKREICKIDIYGNNQLGGLKKIEKYPEIHNIRDAIHNYCSNEILISDYYIDSCYAYIINDEARIVDFNVLQRDGTMKKYKSSINSVNNDYILRQPKEQN